MNSEGETAFLRALGKRVRILRLLANLSQEELGRRAGLSRGFISIIEKGSHGIEIVRLRRLATVLDVPLPQLVDVESPLVASPYEV